MGFNLPEDFPLISLILSNTFTKRSKYVYAWDKDVCVPALRSDHVILREHLPTAPASAAAGGNGKRQAPRRETRFAGGTGP